MSAKRRKGWGPTKKRAKFQDKTGEPRKPSPITVRYVAPSPRRRTK